MLYCLVELTSKILFSAQKFSVHKLNACFYSPTTELKNTQHILGPVFPCTFDGR